MALTGRAKSRARFNARRKKQYSSKKTSSNRTLGGGSSGSKNRVSNDPEKYKYSYGGKSYENKADATAAARADKSGSSGGGNVSSSGGGNDAQVRADQYAQLQQIRDTLAGLQSSRGTKDNQITNSLVDAGKLPESQRENVPQQYTGGSIVDYLNQSGQDSSFASRSKLASQYGISNYSGTAAQNTQLLNTLRSGSASSNSGGVNQAIPSTVVSSGLGYTDVTNRQAELEEIKNKALTIQEQLNFLEEAANQDPTQLLGEEGFQTDNPITDPETLINRIMNQQSDAEKERDRLLGQISDTTSEYYQNREKGLKDAYREYGVDEKTEQLAEVQKQIADRQVRMRNEIQSLETDAEYRGVSREFANDQRENIKSVAAFDMANLAIVESAYAGDLDRSRELAQELVDNQFNTFTGQIETYKAQLTALMPQLNEEQKRRALQIEVALDERQRLLEQAKADKELQYEYATLAAEMNAPLDVTRSILNAGSADEAFMLAAPYISEKAALETESTGGTRGGTTTSVGGYDAVSGLSPFNAPLSNVDITSTSTSNRELENAVRAQFSPDFSGTLFAAMSSEQLRDFMAKYEMAQRSEGMNMDPGIFGNAYLYSIGKTPNLPLSGGQLPPGSFEIDAEDRIRPEDKGKYEIRRVGGILYAIPTATATSGTSSGTAERAANFY